MNRTMRISPHEREMIAEWFQFRDQGARTSIDLRLLWRLLRWKPLDPLDLRLWEAAGATVWYDSVPEAARGPKADALCASLMKFVGA